MLNMQLFGRELKDISYKTLRNKDMREVVVTVSANFCAVSHCLLLID